MFQPKTARFTHDFIHNNVYERLGKSSPYSFAPIAHKHKGKNHVVCPIIVVPYHDGFARDIVTALTVDIPVLEDHIKVV